VNLEITALLDTRVKGTAFSLFYPRTTTFLEMTFDREPLPLDPKQQAKIAVWS
jgi:hypothetical protein